MQKLAGPEIGLPERPVIAVVGAGAVGGYYGARLAQGGHDVHFLLKSDYERVRTEGWNIRSCHGDFQLPRVKAHREPATLPKADLVMVALKTTSEALYEPLVAPLLHEGTVILSIQNGLGPDERLAALFGDARVIGGLAFVCLNRGGPGEIVHLDHGMVRMGEFSGEGSSPRVEGIARMFRDCKIPCEVLPNLLAGRWEKLIWNVPFNGLGAALDLTTDRLIASEAGRELVGKLMGEVIAGAAAHGIRFKLAAEEIIGRQIRATASMGPYRSSMQIDREEGRPLEVEAILGEPWRRSLAKGVAMEELGRLYELVRLADPGAIGRAERVTSLPPTSPPFPPPPPTEATGGVEIRNAGK
jgi:2-dehydropantoate 2-reductase